MIKIGEFANLFNISIKTVRFYEEKELISPCFIDKYSGYRYYDDNNIEQMKKILYLKSLGLSLDEIKNYNENSANEKIKQFEDEINKLKRNISLLEEISNNPQKLEEIQIWYSKDKEI